MRELYLLALRSNVYLFLNDCSVIVWSHQLVERSTKLAWIAKSNPNLLQFFCLSTDQDLMLADLLQICCMSLMSQLFIARSISQIQKLDAILVTKFFDTILSSVSSLYPWFFSSSCIKKRTPLVVAWATKSSCELGFTLNGLIHCNFLDLVILKNRFQNLNINILDKRSQPEYEVLKITCMPCVDFDNSTFCWIWSSQESLLWVLKALYLKRVNL